MQVALGEAQPPVAVEFVRLGKVVLQQVEDEDLSPGLEHDERGLDRGVRLGGVVQRLAQDDEVHARRFDGRIFQVAQAELEVLEPVLLRLLRAELDHLLRVVHGDDLGAAAREQLAQEPFAGTEIGHDDRRQDAQQQMPEGLPTAARSIAAVEAAGHLVEVDLRLLVPTGEDALEIQLIRLVLRQLLRAAQGELGELAHMGVGMNAQPIEGSLAFAPRLHEAGLGQQAKVRGDARLAEAADLLEFVDGKLVLLQQRDDAEARGIGEGAEGFEGGGHVRLIRRMQVLQRGGTPFLLQGAGSRLL